MRHAIPTLRQLETNWKSLSLEDNRVDNINAKQPMPKFLPSATFNELELSEVDVFFPDKNKSSETRSLVSQLYESCPGRVSKRYSTKINEKGYCQKVQRFC